MNALTSSTGRKAALALGAAWALVAILLGWVGSHGREVQAADGRAGEDGGQKAWADKFSPAWDSSAPVTYTLDKIGIVQTWTIPQYDVTIIFPGGSVSWPAVFTFTPELSSTMLAPLSPTPYYFDLEGEYLGLAAQNIDARLSNLEIDESQILVGEVSLTKRITIALKYDPAQLGPVLEETLDVYRRYSSTDEWIALDDLNSTVSIDAAKDTIYLYTRKMQHFGVAGIRYRQVLPEICKSADGALFAPGIAQH